MKPFSSHGATGFSPFLIIALAASTSLSGAAISWISPIALAFCGVSDWPEVSICRASCVLASRGTRWVPPAPGKMPTFTSGSAILTLSPSAATRPWQASDSSKAPPMQVPLIAETQGLPEVSSLRNSQVMRPAPSNSIFTALSGSLAFSSWNRPSMRFSMVRSAPPEKVSLPEVMTAPLIAASPATASMIASSSSITSSVKTFIERSGMSQVTSAMPSASVSTVKFL